MHRRLLALLLPLALALGACGGDGDDAADDDSLTVAASFYPLAWAAEQVGGDLVVVDDLTPAGAEPHDLELTTGQRDRVEDADVVLLLGNGFQPAVEEAAATREEVTVEMLDVLPIEGRGDAVAADDHAEGDDHDEADDHDGEAADGVDPHVWLDPVLMTDVVDEVEAALSGAAPDEAATFAANAERTRAELGELDDEYVAGLAACERRVFVTSHDAFGYLAARYELEEQGVAGLSPDEEPSAARLAELTELVQREGVPVVFTEELVSPEIAETLAREAGVGTEVLSPIEARTEEQVAQGATYPSLMRENLAALRAALGCEPA